MDHTGFDTLSRSLATFGTRRALLRLLPALPLTGILATRLTEEGEAGGRHKRRKTRNRHRSGDDKDNRTGKRTGRGKGKGKKRTPQCTPRSCPPDACGSHPDGCGGTQTCGCSGNRICLDGSCRACDVCATGCAFDAVQAAVDAAASGDTITICPGTYLNAKGRLVMEESGPDLDLTLIGAGDEADPASNSILQNTEAGNRVITEFRSRVKLTLQGLRITGGGSNVGSGILFWGNILTVAGCTIIENTSSNGGGGIWLAGGNLLMRDSTVARNHALGGRGGGVELSSAARATFTNCQIRGNTSGTTGGGVFGNDETRVTFQVANTITENEAPAGSGIFLDAGELVGSAFVTVSGNIPAEDQCHGCPP